MSNSHGVSVLEASASRLAPPPAPRSHMEIARTMTFPDGRLKGELWDPASEPVQFVWVSALDNPRWKKRTRIAPSQRGKSLEAIALPLLRVLIDLQQEAAYILPNLDKLNQAWVGKIRPMIVGCGYGDWLPERGPGSKGGRAAAMMMRHRKTGMRAGTWYFMAAGGGGKEASLASNTVLLAATDEGDDMESDGQLKLGEKRSASFGADGQSIVASTVNDRKGRRGHPALAHYELGTRTRTWFQCPHCAGLGPTAGFQCLVWSQVVGVGGEYVAKTMPDGKQTLVYSQTIEAARAAARYVCAHCSVAWTEADRRRALANYREVHAGQTVDSAGRVAGEPPVGVHYSLLSTDLDYYISSLEGMAEDYAVADAARKRPGRPDHSLMRVFFYKRLCEDYLEDHEEEESGTPTHITREHLTKRARAANFRLIRNETLDQGDSLHVATLPPGPAHLIFTCDVQRGGKKAPPRLYWLLQGIDLDGRSWDLAWGSVILCPAGRQASTAELHAGLTRLDAIGANLAKNFTLPIARKGIDVGDQQDELRAWLTHHRDWWAIKDSSGHEKSAPDWDIPGWIYRREQQPGGWYLYFVDVGARREAQTGFLIPPGEPGAAHLPAGVDEKSSMVRHLCATIEVPDGRGGYRWSDREKDRAMHPEYITRRDMLACRTYARALATQFSRTQAAVQAATVAASGGREDREEAWNDEDYTP